MAVPGAVSDLSTIETSDVTIQSGGDTIDGYLARPRGERRGAIVVIHEAFGPVEHIHDLARRFANLGYDALAPNLYSRAGAPDPTDMPAVMAAMTGLSDAQVVRDLEATVAHLRALPDAAAKVASIGFCSGGRQSLLFGTSSRVVDAVIDCWGGSVERATRDHETTPERPVPVIDLLGGLSCPAFVVGGGDDQTPSPEIVEEVGRRGREAGKDVTTKIYPGVGHAFLADYRPSYSEPQAHELWEDVLAFLRTHIG